MNLLIKIIYLFIIIIAGKLFIPKYIDGTMNQNILMVALLYLSNIIYRFYLNYYFKKKDTIYNIAKEGFYRTILIIVGIVVVNYLISNPKTLESLGFEVPSTNLYTSTAISLVPFLLTKALLSSDV